MNLFDLIPGNDPVSKVINGVTIGAGLVILPIVGIPVAIVAVAAMTTYCAVTGKPMWTLKSGKPGPRRRK